MTGGGASVMPMMGGMGLLWLLVVVPLLAAAAPVEDLFFQGRSGRHGG